ncbi:F-box domain containing protein [Tanacetum coccineum]
MSDYLPFDIQVKIMNKLPVQSLLKFRMVSKSWKFTIDSYIFIRDYGSRESDMCCFNLKYSVGNEHFMFSVDGQMSFTPLNTHFPLTNIKPVTTSKGVWCFSFGSHLGAILWNPSIRKFLGIELPYMPRRPAIEKIVWGFGVRPDTLDATILNISMPFYGDGPWHVVMYILNSDTWTFLGNYRMPRVGIRIKRSWSVLFIIPSQNITKLIGFTRDEDPIVEVNSGQDMLQTLQVYDRPSQQFHNVGIEANGGSFFIGPYKESLILLNGR